MKWVLDKYFTMNYSPGSSYDFYDDSGKELGWIAYFYTQKYFNYYFRDKRVDNIISITKLPEELQHGARKMLIKSI